MVIDRGIGIAGISLSVIFGALSYFPNKVPTWMSITGLAIGIFVLGISIGVMWSGRKKINSLKPADNAILRLHTFRDHRNPEHLEMKNIFRWYLLSHILRRKNNAGKEEEFELPTLFVSFYPDVRVTTLKVRSPDMKLPRYEVKEFNQKYAIVVFSSKLKEGTLELIVEP